MRSGRVTNGGDQAAECVLDWRFRAAQRGEERVSALLELRLPAVLRRHGARARSLGRGRGGGGAVEEDGAVFESPNSRAFENEPPA